MAFRGQEPTVRKRLTLATDGRQTGVYSQPPGGQKTNSGQTEQEKLTVRKTLTVATRFMLPGRLILEGGEQRW